MSDLISNKHMMPIRPVHEGRLNHGSGPCKIIMRGGKMLPEPEIVECDSNGPMSLCEVQKNKKAGKGDHR